MFHRRETGKCKRKEEEQEKMSGLALPPLIPSQPLSYSPQESQPIKLEYPAEESSVLCIIQVSWIDSYIYLYMHILFIKNSYIFTELDLKKPTRLGFYLGEEKLKLQSSYLKQ